MIAINGVLVLVAVVLLVVGLAGSGLTVIYASIVASVLALASLALGPLQRRGTGRVPTAPVGPSPYAASPAAPAAPDAGVAATTGVPAYEAPTSSTGSRPLGGTSAPVPPEPPVEHDDEVLDDEEEFGGLVSVVPGHPRYHVPGCRHLEGQRVEELDVVDAREEGYGPCGACAPDAVLAARAEQHQLAEVRPAGHSGSPPQRGPDDGTVVAPRPVVFEQTSDDPAEAHSTGAADPVAGGSGPSTDGPVPPDAPASPRPVAAGRALAGLAGSLARDATMRGAAAARRRVTRGQRRIEERAHGPGAGPRPQPAAHDGTTAGGPVGTTAAAPSSTAEPDAADPAERAGGTG